MPVCYGMIHKIVFSKIIPDGDGIMVPVSFKSSDLAIPISVVKKKFNYYY